MTYIIFKHGIPYIDSKEVINKKYLIELMKSFPLWSNEEMRDWPVSYGICTLHYVNDGNKIFVAGNDLTRRLPLEPCNCGVGHDVHGTCCGWGNAAAVCDELRICDDRHPYYNKNVNDWINSDDFLTMRS